MTKTPGPMQLTQLARLLGDGELHSKSIDTTRLRGLLGERLERLARGLLEEAVASDDVIDAGSAEAYLEDRLAFFGELLSEEQRRRVRALYSKAVDRWGAG